MRDLTVAFGSSRNAKNWSCRTVRYEEFIDMLRVTRRTAETAAEYRAMGRAERDAAKDSAGCFVAGVLKDGSRTMGSLVSRSMITQDADNASPGYIGRVKNFSPYDSLIYSTHSHTPSSPRLRHIYPLTRDVSPDEYAAISRYLAAEQGIEQYDECSFRPNQLMYLPTTSSDGEYIFEHIRGRWLNPDEFLAQYPGWRDCSGLPGVRDADMAVSCGRRQADPLAKKGITGAFCRAYGIREAIEAFLGDVYRPSAVSGRYDYIPAESAAGVVIYDDRFAYSFHATDPAYGRLMNSYDLVRLHRFGESGAKEMRAFAAEDSRVRRRVLEERKAAADAAAGDWREDLTLNERGGLESSLRNLNLIMANDEYMRHIVFNQLADSIEIAGEVPWKHPSRYWRDADDAQLICYIDSHYGSFPQSYYGIAVTKAADDRSYHPIREYLDSLPEWDGVGRVDTLLVDYFGAEDSGYVRAVTRKTLCAAVARVMEPGIKFDYALVLNGPQTPLS